MSIRVMSWVWEHSRAEGTDRLVLLAIADCASDDGGNAWPSIATLAGKAKVSERTVQRSVRALTLLGEVAVTPNAGRHGSNVYTVTMTGRQSGTPSDSHPVNLAPRQSDTVTPVTPRGDTGVTRTVLEPSSPPNPPARGGPMRRRAHCPKHVRHNAKCPECVRLQERDDRQATWPPWCGGCDENTRKLADDLLSRCPECHPLRKAAS